MHLSPFDTEQVWAETFAHWDCLVDTDTAVAIATAVVSTLEASQTEDDHCPECARSNGPHYRGHCTH